MEERNEYLLDQYFSKRITQTELAEMRDLMAKDPSFAEEFAFQQKVAAAVVSRERAELKARLMELENKGKGPQNWSVWTKTILSIAAVIAMIAVAWPLFRQYNTPPSSSPLNSGSTEVKFTSYPNEFAGAGSSAPTPEQAATDAYQRGEFAEAARLYAAITPPQPAYRFYQGIALIGAQQYDQALTVLRPLAEENSADYGAPARYYLALAHYLSGNKAQAKTEAQKYLASPAKTSEKEMRDMANVMNN